MKKETKFWIALSIVLGIAISSQLLGQDVYDTPEEVDKAIQTQEIETVQSKIITMDH